MEMEPQKQAGTDEGREVGSNGKSEGERRAEAEKKQAERPKGPDDGDMLG